ncbi:MAG TPA: glycosyltransferase [Candidatus Binatia bacterium]|nr:glycosyltransferase [Candidatus Binatia bacterium]
MQLSVIVPSYNEAKTLQRTLPELYAYLRTLPWSFEIIVGNDGSTDNTGEVVRVFSKGRKNIRLVSYAKNRGKGGILTECFKRAKGDWQLFIDADLSIEKRLIPALIAALHQGDIAIASKHAPGARVAYPLVRKITSNGFQVLTRWLFHVPLRDFQCGLKGFRKDVMRDLLPSIHNQRFLWDTELLIKAYRKHYKIVEIPAIVHPAQRSSVHIVRDTWRMFRGLLALAQELNEGR